MRFQHTDLGNAERLMNQYGHDILYCHPLGGWLVWDGRRWKLDTDGAIMRLAHDTVRIIPFEEEGHPSKDTLQWAVTSESAYRLKAMVELAAALASAKPETFDKCPWVFNAQNGTVDLRTGELRQHDRTDYISKVAPASYDPDAPAPEFRKFLDRIQPDVLMRDFLARAAGYCLTGVTGEECLFLPYGPGRNGKSKWVGALQSAMGNDYAKPTSPAVLMGGEGNGPSPYTASLRGMRFISTIETNESGRLDEATVKQLTGGDIISARMLHCPPIEFPPTFKVWLVTNHKPVVRGSDEGIWSRIRLIPFETTIPEEERDTELESKLAAERDGILAWAVRGCLEWQRIGLALPERVKTATADYRESMDWLGAWIADRCELDPNAETQAGEAYANFKRWCELNGEHLRNGRQFGDALTERGYSFRTVNGRRYRRGFRLLSINEEHAFWGGRGPFA